MEGGISLGKAAGDEEALGIVAWRKKAGTLRTAANKAALVECGLCESVREHAGPDPGRSERVGKAWVSF